MAAITDLTNIGDGGDSLTDGANAFLGRLRRPGLALTVELRPPRLDHEPAQSADAWFEMGMTLHQLVASETPVFLTDSAVGTREEENLNHLIANLEEDVERDGICPFLTTKHTLEYCLWYAARAVAARSPALTVLGGDRHVGPPRCVPHGYLLRKAIRERFPGLALGGWANPHADPARQVGFLTQPDATADFYLTQLVSHHHLPQVDAFLEARARAGLSLPAVFGVFYYRSARPRTLARLGRFFPVPAEGLTRDFAAGMGPEEVLAASIRALRARGIEKFYVSNLPNERVEEVLAHVRELLDRP